MKILWTADWQCRLSNLDQCEDLLTSIITTIQNYKVNLMVHLGDWRDQRNALWDVRVSNFLVHSVKEILKYCNLITIPGNHDMIGLADGVPTCMPVLASAGATVFTKPARFGPIYLIPFIRDRAALLKAFKDAEPSPILGFHNSIKGCKLSVQRIDTEGITIKEMNPLRFLRCIGGHIHYGHSLSPNITYIGSPFPMDWNEVNSPNKGVLITDTTDLAKGVVSLVSEFVPLNFPPMWDPDLPGFDVKQARFRVSTMRVRIPYESQEQLDKAVKTYQKKYPLALLHVVPVYSSLDNQAPEEVALKSDRDLVKKYLEANPISSIHPLVKKYLEIEPLYTSEDALDYIVGKLQATGMADMFKIRGLKFNEVSAMNILSFEKVSYKLDRPGLTLVTAKNLDWPGRGSTYRSNGGGKTSLLSLPVIALFGETPKGQKNNGLLRRGTKKGAVCQALRLADGKTCTIVRGRPAALDVNVNGKDISMGDVNTTQRLIEQLTNLTWDVLVSSIYIGQGEISIILHGTEKERQQLFSRFIGLERFIKALELVRKDIHKTARFYEDVEREIELSQNKIASIEEVIKATQSTNYIDRESYNNKMLQLSNTINELAKTGAEDETDVGHLNKTLKNCKEAHYKTTKALALVHYKLETFEKEMEKCAKLEAECPLCGSKIDPEALHERISQLKKEMEADCQLAKRLEKENWVLNSRITKIEAKLSYYESCKLNKKLDIERIRIQKARLQELRNESRKQEEVQANHKAELERYKYGLQCHEACKQDLADHYKFLEECSNVVARDGLPAFLCSMFCPQLNLAAAGLSQEFSDGEIGVQFSVIDGSIDIQIQNPHGGERVIDQSAGELRLAALIASLALREVMVPYNLLILDEPGENLDSESAGCFARGINATKERFGSIFLTTHNQQILSELEPDHHLEVTKSGGISTLKELQ